MTHPTITPEQVRTILAALSRIDAIMKEGE